ncbi:MAG: hypothetical protein AB7S83_05735 [Candidatus Methanomethylophilaceae archaeon]|jgi:hypothetical protein
MGEDGKEDRSSSRSEMEDFFNENRGFIEALIEKERKAAEDAFEKKMDDARQHADRAKKSAEDAVRQIYKVAMDPVIQGHFMTAGFEIMMGINAALRSMPVPDFIKEDTDAKEEKAGPEEAKPKRRPKAQSKAIPIDVPEEVPKTVTRRKKKPASEEQDES